MSYLAICAAPVNNNDNNLMNNNDYANPNTIENNNSNNNSNNNGNSNGNSNDNGNRKNKTYKNTKTNRNKSIHAMQVMANNAYNEDNNDNDDNDSDSFDKFTPLSNSYKSSGQIQIEKSQQNKNLDSRQNSRQDSRQDSKHGIKDESLTVEKFSNLSSNSDNDYYDQYALYKNNSMESNNDDYVSNNNAELLKKLDNILHILEEQNEEKTNYIIEELILYVFLGIFVIFIIDSFVKAGKYTR